MSSIRVAAVSAGRAEDLAARAQELISTSAASNASDREYLLDRLQNLRAIVPAFAQELASARRQAARLRIENRRLLDQVAQLQSQRVDRDPQSTS